MNGHTKSYIMSSGTDNLYDGHHATSNGSDCTNGRHNATSKGDDKHSEHNSMSNGGDGQNGGQQHQRGKLRAWMDGCFDMVHLNHMLAFYRAKQHCDTLTVATQSDDVISVVKGPPVFTQAERRRLLKGVKFVDEVVEEEDVPYGTTAELLDRFQCDFCIHGDDPSIATDEKDILRELMKVNRMKFVDRGYGISTSMLIDRILDLTRDSNTTSNDKGKSGTNSNGDHSHKEDLVMGQYPLEKTFPSMVTHMAAMAPRREPQPGQKIVYAPGIFDLFHVGHQEFLDKAAAMGDYLIVGVYGDTIAKQIKGSFFPVMTLSERVLRLLACKCVDDVYIDAPFVVTQFFIKEQPVDLVCHGETPVGQCGGADPFEVSKRLGIYRTVSSSSELRGQTIVNRIVKKRAAYEERNRKKRVKNCNADLAVDKTGNTLVADTAHIGRRKGF